MAGFFSSVEGTSSETPERQLLEQLLHLLASVDQGVLTGDPCEAGYKFPATSKTQVPKAPNPLNNTTIIQRIRVSYPALRAARVTFPQNGVKSWGSGRVKSASGVSYILSSLMILAGTWLAVVLRVKDVLAGGGAGAG